MGGGAQVAAGRGPEPGLSRPCPSDSSMEALTLNLTEVVKRQNPKSKKGFNQVRTPLSPPRAFGRPWRGWAPACAHARVQVGGDERQAGGAVWGAHAVGCPRGGCVRVQRLWWAPGEPWVPGERLRVWDPGPHSGAVGLLLGALVASGLGEDGGRRGGRASCRLPDPCPSWPSAPESCCWGGLRERATKDWRSGLMGASLPDKHVADQSGQGADHRLQRLPLRRVPGPGREEDPTERGPVGMGAPGRGPPLRHPLEPRKELQGWGGACPYSRPPHRCEVSPCYKPEKSSVHPQPQRSPDPPAQTTPDLCSLLCLPIMTFSGALP